MLGSFPLFALILIAFNVVVFAGGAMFGFSDITTAFSEPLVRLPMVSGDPFEFTLGGLFIVASLAILFIEILKSTQTNEASTLNHAFSLIIFVISLVEFLVVKGFGNEYFFIILIMTLIDVVAGYTVTISAARRDFGGVSIN